MPRPRRSVGIEKDDVATTKAVNTTGTASITRAQLLLPLDQPSCQPSLLALRNQFEFSNLFQFVTLFRKAFMVPVSEPFSIEILEEELILGLGETRLFDQIRLGLLTTLLNYRSVKLSEFNEFGKRAFNKFGFLNEDNPFSVVEPPSAIEDENESAGEEKGENQGKPGIITFETQSLSEQITILYRMSRLLITATHFRDRINQHLLTPSSSLNATPLDEPSEEFRVEPVGYVNEDGSGGSYYLLDDNRLYLQVESWPPVTSAPEVGADIESEERTVPTKKRKRGYYTGGKKRRKVKKTVTLKEEEEENEKKMEYSELIAREPTMQWECICVTMSDWQALLDRLSSRRGKSASVIRHDSVLFKYLQQDVLPVIEESELARVKAALARSRERERDFLVANRKRSSRLEEKLLKLKEEETRQLEIAALRATRERERQEKLEQRRLERDRLEKEAAREVRFRDREEKREKREKREDSINQILQRSDDNSIESVNDNNDSLRSRSSTRLLEQEKQQLLNEETWEFDCICGAFGNNYDDGSLIIQCGVCSMWMHVRCNSMMEYLKTRGETGEDLKRKVYSYINRADSTFPRDEMRDIKAVQRHLLQVDEFVCERCANKSLLWKGEEKSDFVSEPAETQDEVPLPILVEQSVPKPVELPIEPPIDGLLKPKNEDRDEEYRLYSKNGAR
ncbi:hypothetical protein NADFUDRAFT_39578 [Nadsonia fulvescens var. elongata DSM 6958]|uniref:Zinc finger PHD-type domain-containing protein n=1 Tax=Nadsonia fulvescens var. elongata DSM 6958 TaxID=857566 RepID=A0A1E3PRX5_9ASCO|nr:hypothetical protein NADFUDRAFT_39578 [Nadsonia fulvescens var. elongata DSM 6958]